MSHQKLLNSLLKQKLQGENTNITSKKPNNIKKPSLKEVMSIINMFDPNSNYYKNDEEDKDNKNNIIMKQSNKTSGQLVESNNTGNDNNNTLDVIEIAEKLNNMYVKKTDDIPNKYLFCQKTKMYLPVGYRYVGYHTSNDTGKKTFLYTRKENNVFVIHCLGKKIDTHDNYDVYEQIDITSQLPNHIIQTVINGNEIVI